MSFYLFRKMIRKLPGVVIKAVPKPEPVIVDGFGSREKVGKICAEAGYKLALLVADKIVHSLGFHEKILDSLKAYGIKYAVFNNTRPSRQLTSSAKAEAPLQAAEPIAS